jgi:hypothetical protein
MQPHDELPERRQLRDLIVGWDPLGVGELGLEFQPDLYDNLIEPLLHRLGCGASRRELAGFLVHEVRDEFGKDPVEPEIDEFVGRLVAWHAGEFGRRADG